MPGARAIIRPTGLGLEVSAASIPTAEAKQECLTDDQAIPERYCTPQGAEAGGYWFAEPARSKSTYRTATAVTSYSMTEVQQLGGKVALGWRHAAVVDGAHEVWKRVVASSHPATHSCIHLRMNKNSMPSPNQPKRAIPSYARCINNTTVLAPGLRLLVTSRQRSTPESSVITERRRKWGQSCFREPDESLAFSKAS